MTAFLYTIGSSSDEVCQPNQSKISKPSPTVLTKKDLITTSEPSGAALSQPSSSSSKSIEGESCVP